MNPLKVCVFRATDGACDYYRTVIPTNTAAVKKAIEKSELWMANILVTMMVEQEKFIKSADSDIFFLQRVSGSSLIDKLKSFADASKINAHLVMDYDDDVFNVSPLSNHYVDYGTEEIKIAHNGKVIHEWKDGENINIKENQKRIDEIKLTCSKVDMLTTTTEHLAKVFRQFNPNVKVLPNCVDMESWGRLKLVRDNPEEIRIAWAGGHSHWEDLYLVRNALKEIAAKYPNVKIVMVGYMPNSMEKDFRPGQIEFHKWVETPAHPYRIAALDIDMAIIPLKDTIFNRSKSTIKWVEFSSLEIPCITSYVPPYDSIQDADEVNKGIFVENNDENSWFNSMEILINDAKLRREIGKNAQQFVKDHHDINTQYHQWVEAFKEVKCQLPQILRS